MAQDYASQDLDVRKLANDLLNPGTTNMAKFNAGQRVTFKQDSQDGTIKKGSHAIVIEDKGTSLVGVSFGNQSGGITYVPRSVIK